jgi:Ca2+-binding RTX toxin-like protein
MRPGVEALEGRDLLTGAIVYPEPPEPPPNRGPVYLNTDGTLYIKGSNSNDNVVVSYSGDRLAVTMSGGRSVNTTFARSAVFWIVFTGNDGHDTFQNLTAVPCDLDGGAGNDSLSGGSGHNWIQGAAGNDSLQGGSSGDWLYGGWGNDLLYGSGGNDGLYGQEDVDVLHGQDGNDWLDGGFDLGYYGYRDQLFGEQGADTFVQHYYWHYEYGHWMWGQEDNRDVRFGEGDVYYNVYH